MSKLSSYNVKVREDLIKAFNLPPHTKRITFTYGAQEAAMLVIERYVEVDEIERFKTVIEKYNLKIDNSKDNIEE